MQTAKWYLEKKYPDEFGNRTPMVAIQQNAEKINNVTQEDLSRILEDL